MIKIFKKMNLNMKLTLFYILLVFIPITLVSVQSYFNLQKFLLKDMINKELNQITQIQYNIQRNEELVTNISNNICYNSDLRRFLALDNISPYTIYEQYDNIKNLNKIHDVDIEQITILMHKYNTLDYSNAFFSDVNLSEQPWYQNYKDGSKLFMWDINHKISGIEGKKITRPVFNYIHKIQTLDGRYLGSVIIDLPIESFLRTVYNDEDSSTICIQDSNGDLILQAKDNPALKYAEMPARNQQDKGYYLKNNVLYTYCRISSLGIVINRILPINNLNNPLNNMNIVLTIIIIIANLCIIVFFFVIKRYIIGSVMRNISTMEKIVENNFDGQIPIENDDELGKIAKYFNVLLEKIGNLVRDCINKEVSFKQAQLKALQLQINPHFIYNTIEIFSSKMELAKNYEVADAFVALGKMLRYNLHAKSFDATIRQEISYIESYIRLQNLRYENRILLVTTISKEVENIKMIRFILQPIVENSVIHGLKNEKELIVNIQAYIVDQGDMCIEIHDDGVGIPTEKLSLLNQEFKREIKDEEEDIHTRGIGLRNINERLKLFYGNDYHMVMDSIYGKGVKTIITIPVKTKEE